MAKGNRDSRSEYARRNELAREAGWNSIGQERYAKEQFKSQPLDVQGKWYRFLHFGKGEGLSKAQERAAFRDFWQGLIDPRTRDDTSAHSPKANWFVDWLDLDEFDGDHERWEELYGEDQ